MMNEEEFPTVFVVPPNASLKCPLHFGVFDDPVDSPCGCTFCRRCITEVLSHTLECPLHSTPLTVDQLRTNEYARAFVSELLIHCQGGLQKSASGEWIPSTTGCKLWISLGKRHEHEDTCTYVKRHAERPPIPSVKRCRYYEQGCLFTGHTDQDTLLHTEQCGYGRLLRYIEQLQVELASKNSEIERLNSLMGEQEDTIRLALPSVPNVSQILDSISRGLEKLDEDSTRLFEDAKDSLKKTKSAVVSSSLQVFGHIKEMVESARTEFVAKMEELETIAKIKLNSLTHPNKHVAGNITYYENPAELPTIPLINNTDTHTTSESTDVNSDNTDTNSDSNDDSINSNENNYESLEENSNENNNENSNTENTSNTATPTDNTQANTVTPIPEMTSESEVVGDEDLKEFLEASKQEYLKDQASRMMEEEALRQAMRLSLLDLAGNSQK